MSRGKPYRKCRKHGVLRDRFGNCWTCLEQAETAAEKALRRTMNPRQLKLFEKYQEAKQERTSAIIRD